MIYICIYINYINLLSENPTSISCEFEDILCQYHQLGKNTALNWEPQDDWLAQIDDPTSQSGKLNSHVLSDRILKHLCGLL